MSRVTGSGPVLCLNSVRLFNPITKTDLSYFPKLHENCCRKLAKLSPLHCVVFSVHHQDYSSFVVTLLCYITVVHKIYHLRLPASAWAQFIPKRQNRDCLSGINIIHYRGVSCRISEKSSTNRFGFTLRHCALRPDEATKFSCHRNPIVILDGWLVLLSSQWSPVKKTFFLLLWIYWL